MAVGFPGSCGKQAQGMRQLLGAVIGCPGVISDFSTSQKEKKIPIPFTLVATITLSASRIKRGLGDLRLQMEWNWILLPKIHKLSS